MKNINAYFIFYCYLLLNLFLQQKTLFSKDYSKFQKYKHQNEKPNCVKITKNVIKN